MRQALQPVHHHVKVPQQTLRHAEARPWTSTTRPYKPLALHSGSALPDGEYELTVTLNGTVLQSGKVKVGG